MVNSQTAPKGFNNADWKLFPGNKNHVRFLKKCTELFWLIWECQQLTGEAFFSQEWLAQRLKISVRHVQNLIAELKSTGLITIDRHDHNYYKVTEFFSQYPDDWTEIARKKAKATLAKLFPNRVGKKSDTENKSNKPKKETSFKVDKTKPTQNQAPNQRSKEEQAAIDKHAQEEAARINAEFEAKHEAEKQALDPELKQDVEEVAEQVAKEHHKKTRPSPSEFANKIKNKLKEYGLEAPRWLVGEVALHWLKKHSYHFA